MRWIVILSLHQISVLLTHPVHQVIHTREVCPHADLVFVHCLVSAHSVEPWSTLTSLQNIFKSCLKQTVAHLVSKENDIIICFILHFNQLEITCTHDLLVRTLVKSHLRCSNLFVQK